MKTEQPKTTEEKLQEALVNEHEKVWNLAMRVEDLEANLECREMYIEHASFFERLKYLFTKKL